MRRATAAVGVALLIGALALALMPFNDGAVRCEPPLLGAEASLTNDGRLGLVLTEGCTDPAVRRLVLATALFPAGIVTTAIGLWLSWPIDTLRTST